MNDQPRRFLQRVWESVRQPPTSAAARVADNLIALCDSLLSERGEVSGARIAAEAMAAYEDLSDSARDAFFGKLLDHYAADAGKVNRAIDAYRDESGRAMANPVGSTLPPNRAGRSCSAG